MPEQCPDCRGALSPADTSCPTCARVLAEPAVAPPQAAAAPRTASAAAVVPADSFRGSVIMAGVFLLVAFAMPVMGPLSQVIFPNIEVLGEPDAGGALRFQALFPAIAGLIILLAGLRMRGFGRAALLLALGLVAVVSLAALGSESRSFQREFAGTGGTTILMLAAASWTLLLIGAHSASVRHESRAPAIIGSVGAGLFLLYMFLPLLKTGPFGPQILAVVPFKLLDSGRSSMTTLAGLTGLLALLAGVSASLLAFLSLGSAQTRKALARPGRLLVWLNLAFLLGIFSVASSSGFFALGREGPPVLAVILLIAKSLAWILGILLLIPLGGSELMVCLVDAQGAARASPQAGLIRTAALAPALALVEGARLPSATARMNELLRLRDAGLINAEEFEEKRLQIVRDL